MANIVFPNHQGVWIGSVSNIPGGTIPLLTTVAATLDASGESFTLVGSVMLEGGADSPSKTISSAGGAIYYAYSSAVTFANAGTNLRVGIQDVGATGLEDGVFDVYADLVGGTDTLPLNQLNKINMEVGSKTLNHGDEIAISFELTARAGADSVNFAFVGNSVNSGSLYPYRTVDGGAGPAKSNQGNPVMAILFDDGTIGWIYTQTPAFMNSSVSFDLNSTPDEHALIFECPFSGVVSKIVAVLNVETVGSTFEVVVYSNPLVTPAIVQTLTIDPNKSNIGVINTYDIKLVTPFVFEKDTPYAISIRPTSAGNVTLYRCDFNTGNSLLRRATTLGENWSLGTRTGQAGAFASTDTIIPQIGFFVSEIEAGGGGTSLFS